MKFRIRGMRDWFVSSTAYNHVAVEDRTQDYLTLFLRTLHLPKCFETVYFNPRGVITSFQKKSNSCLVKPENSY